MDIWELGKFSMFILFFIPGFISIKIYDLLVPSERRDFSKSLFEVLGYSGLNFAALSWLIIIIFNQEENVNQYIFLISVFFILFLAPILWPLLILRLWSWPRLKKIIIHPIQKPWDFVFRKREPYWMIVHLKDGRKIGGKYFQNSFASSNPAKEQIYIEEVWKLDEEGKFIQNIDRSAGILILHESILAVELFKI